MKDIAYLFVALKPPNTLFMNIERYKKAIEREKEKSNLKFDESLEVYGDQLFSVLDPYWT